MNTMATKLAVQYEDSVGKLLDVDKCIMAVKKIEEAKIQSITNIQKAAKAGKIPQHAVPVILEVDKTRVIDKLFLESQVDNEDIGKTVRELNLQENEDFKKMLAEVQDNFKKA